MLPLGEGLVSIPPPELFTGVVSILVTCHPLCELTEYTVVGTASSSASTVGMPVTSSDDPQALFS